MKNSNYVSLFIFIGFHCLILNTQGLEAKESVPVLIWQDEKPPIESASVSAAFVPAALIQGKYLKSFNQENILLFLQDQLSVEDLSSHEEVFKNVNTYMKQHHSLYLPSVEAKGSLAHSFTAQGYNLVTLEPGTSAGEINLKKGMKNLVLVKLPSTSTNPYRRKALQKTDEIISNVISKIGKKAKFTIIFTGEEPSVKLESETEHRRTSRSLKQSGGDDHHMHYTNCVLLYLRGDIIIEKGNNSYVLLNNKTQDDIPDCHDNDASIIIKYKDLEEYTKVSVKFHFVKTSRRWTLLDAELSEMNENDQMNTASLVPYWPMEHVPLNKSYTCSQNLVLKSNDTKIIKMVIQGMQVEAFTSGQEAFNAGWDCVGFFTIPIWTGIFAGLLMVMILAMGMYMLSEVKTMDRFDDPKGKPMMVTGSNE